MAAPLSVFFDSLLTAIISQLESSDHGRHFPGERLTPLENTCGQGNNILHVAAKYKESTDDVESILASRPLLAHETNAKGDTPLHIAARLGKLDLVECLVKYAKKRLGVEAEHKELLRMVNNKGNTALHEAVMNGHCDIAELLIKEDPKLTCFDNEDGESPLFLAVDGGYERIALLVLGTFPECSISGRNGLSVMHAFVIRRQSRIIDKLFVPKKIAELVTCIFKLHDFFMEEVLTKCGSEILEIPDEFGWMPHHCAANMGISRILKIMLRTSRSLAYIKDKEGMSALHISAKNGQIGVIKTLIEECPDVCELLDNKGQTALHTAVKHRQGLAVHAILNTIAFDDLLNDQDNEGNTALHLSCVYGHYEIIIPLVADPRTNKRIINKKGMTAFDIMNRSSILGPFDKFMIKSQWKIKNPNSLQEVTAVRYTKERQKLATFPENDHQLKMLAPKKEGASIGEKNRSRLKKEDKRVENTAGINLLVATIIASITFTAAMAMPGGYSSNGLANLRKQTSFRYFLAFDSLAFGCSAASMIMHFAVRAQSKLRGEAYKYPIHMTTMLTFLSITSTVLAFIMGTYTVLYQNESVPNSKSGFGLPGNIAFTAFFATLLYLFLPLKMAFFNYIKGIIIDIGTKSSVVVLHVTRFLVRRLETF